jgi:membrane associated rhomboid family serine protease
VQTCFPGFSTRSVTFIYVISFIMIFIIQKIVYVQMKDLSWFCMLYDSGARFTYAIVHKYQLHRLLVPMFLHLNMMHIFWNTLSFFMIGFTIEKAINNRKKYIMLLIMGALGGNLFSSVMDPY